MTSQAKIEANQANAAKSTGPRTAEGKAASRMNATKHGLTAGAIVLHNEDPEEFVAFRSDLLASLKPEGGLEALFAERVVINAWRLMRSTRAEIDMLESELKYEIAPVREVDEFLALLDGRLGKERELPEKTIGAAMRNLACSRDLLGKLTRYESAIDRAFRGALHELQRLQAARAGQLVAPPVAVDVNLNGGFVSQNRPETAKVPDVLAISETAQVGDEAGIDAKRGSQACGSHWRDAATTASGGEPAT